MDEQVRIIKCQNLVENNCFYVLLKTEEDFIGILHSTAHTHYSSRVDPKNDGRISARDNLEGLGVTSQRELRLKDDQARYSNLRCPRERWCGRSRCRRRGVGGGCRCAHGEPHRRGRERQCQRRHRIRQRWSHCTSCSALLCPDCGVEGDLRVDGGGQGHASGSAGDVVP